MIINIVESYNFGKVISPGMIMMFMDQNLLHFTPALRCNKWPMWDKVVEVGIVKKS